MEAKLRELLRENRVIPFVGAGVSMSVKDISGKDLFYNWEKSLDLLIEGLEKECQDYIRGFKKFENPDYLGLADKIKSQYPDLNDFYSKLKEIFDIKHDKVCQDSLDLSRAIWDLQSPLIITTNYDNTLKWASPSKDDTKQWDIQHICEQGETVRGELEDNAVWHLHGHINNKRNIILTTEGYNDLYSESSEKFKTAYKTLQTLLTTKSFLFIGYSLEDEFLVNELEKICNIFDNLSATHYVLLKEGKTLDKRLDKKIVPIYYKDRGTLADEIRALRSEPSMKKATEEKQDEVQEEEKPETNQLTSLPAKKDDFIGRKKELEEISKRLDKNNLLYVVNGIGGIGKSEISNKYLHDNVNKYDNVAFLQVTENQDIEDLFITKLKEPLKLFGEVNFDSVIQALQQLKGKNLLLIDDLSKVEDFEKIKPISNSFDVLITTRKTSLDVNEKNQLNLNVLTKEEAEELFKKISKVDKNIEDILEFLDYHPLMIILTAKSIKLGYTTLEELQESVKSGEIPKMELEDDKDFSFYLNKHFSNQLQKEENQELKDLLEVLSIFPPIEIELSVFEKIIDDSRIKIKLQKLVERGWLIQKENSYKLHQIIKTFLLEENPPTFEKVSSILENIGDFLDPNNSELIANNFLHYIPLIDSILDQFKDMKNETIAKLLDSLMLLYYAQGEYKTALVYGEKSKEIREKVHGNDGEKTALSYSLMGRLLDEQGEYNKALPFYKKALEIRESVLGEKYPETASSYNNLAELFRSQGEYDKALPFYEKALEIYKSVLGEKHPETATIYNNLALLFYSQGEYDKALPFYEKALEIYKSVLGEKHPDTATSYNNLAGLFKSQGEYDKALPFYEKALEIHESVLGEKHPYTATSYNNLAGLFESQGEYDKALPLYEKALEIRESVLGEKHPDTATSYNNLAGLFESQGKYDKALPLYEKALEICESVLGKKHPNTAGSYNNLAGLFESQGKYDKALPLYEKALEICESVLGKKHPNTAISYNNLAKLFRAQGAYEKAVPYYEKALKIIKTVLGEQHPTTKIVSNNYQVLLNQMKQKKSFNLLDKILKR